MKYKAGDKVRVKSQEWYNMNKDEDNKVKLPFASFVDNMCPFLGKCVIIESLRIRSYSLVGDDYGWDWTDEMFEGLVEPTIEEKLIQLIQDNSNLPQEEFNILIESYLDSLIPYNHGKDLDIREACNVNLFITTNKIKELMDEYKKSDFSIVVENIIQRLSKRELAFLLLANYITAK